MKTKPARDVEHMGFWELNRASGGALLRNSAKKWAISIARGLLLFGLCFMIIQPILTRLGVGFMEEQDLSDSTVVLLPRHPTLDNYRIVFELTDFPRSMLNTAWTSLVVSVLQVISSTLVAYGFARYNFPLKKFWFACVVALIVIPPQTFASSLYIMFTNFDILGIFQATTGKTLNLRGSITPYILMSATCMGLKNGLYIYMLRQYFRSVPKSRPMWTAATPCTPSCASCCRTPCPPSSPASCSPTYGSGRTCSTPATSCPAIPSSPPSWPAWSPRWRAISPPRPAPLWSSPWAVSSS